MDNTATLRLTELNENQQPVRVAAGTVSGTRQVVMDAVQEWLIEYGLAQKKKTTNKRDWEKGEVCRWESDHAEVVCNFEVEE